MIVSSEVLLIVLVVLVAAFTALFLSRKEKSPEEDNDPPIYFGKYKGTPFSQLPLHYKKYLAARLCLVEGHEVFYYKVQEWKSTTPCIKCKLPISQCEFCSSNS